MKPRFDDGGPMKRQSTGGSGQMMRLFAGLLFVLIMATLARAQGQGDKVTPIPAWCGGSYSITGGLEPKEYVEAVKAGQPLGSGTNFGDCVDAVKAVRSPAGTIREISVPTYPAAPAAQVTFSDDGRVVYQNGEADKDGNAIVVELKLPEIPQ
jgi:hypothetical protein